MRTDDALLERLQNSLKQMPYEIDKHHLRMAIDEIVRLNNELSKYPYNDSMLKRVD